MKRRTKREVQWHQLVDSPEGRHLMNGRVSGRPIEQCFFMLAIEWPAQLPDQFKQHLLLDTFMRLVHLDRKIPTLPQFEHMVHERALSTAAMYVIEHGL